MSENTNKEHETYLRIMEEYENAKRKRLVYRRKGAAFIIISGIIFLTLMFSLESKIEFLVLWVVSDFFCAALMIKRIITITSSPNISALRMNTAITPKAKEVNNEKYIWNFKIRP